MLDFMGINMQDTDETLKKIPFKQVFKMVIPYWVSDQKKFALSMLFLVVVLNGVFIYVNVLFNEWNRRFYDSMVDLNYDGFIQELYTFIYLAMAGIFFFVTKNFSEDFLEFKWRQWLTNVYLNKWINNKNYYRMMLVKKPVDNPDQRIQQDLSAFASLTLTIFIKLGSEVANVITFSIILWTLSGAITITAFGGEFELYGYLFYTVIIYCAFTTYVIIKIGKPLVKLSFLQERYEANFRYNLVRVRERREEVSIYSGENYEKTNILNCFSDIVRNFYQIIVRKIYINGWQNFSINASTIMPFLLTSPKLFAGLFTLGMVMQIYSAFSRVENSLNVIVLSYNTLAQWKATSNRLVEFFEHLELMEDSRANKLNGDINITKATNKNLEVKNLSLFTPQKRQILDKINLKVSEGEKIVIWGKSGIGKSTLIRALSGIWPYAEGEIILPDNKEIMFVPQRPYMPIGTLRQSLVYPLETNEVKMDDSKIKEFLHEFRLDKLKDSLDLYLDWSNALSLGEQQRVNFIRILVRNPDWIIMDEPSASIGKEDEDKFFQMIEKHLKNVSIITVSHSPTMIKHHDRIVEAKKFSTS